MALWDPLISGIMLTNQFKEGLAIVPGFPRLTTYNFEVDHTAISSPHDPESIRNSDYTAALCYSYNIPCRELLSLQ